MKKLVKLASILAVAVVLLGILGWYAEIELLSDALLPGMLANAVLAPKGRFGFDGVLGLLVGYGSNFIAWFALIFLLAVVCRFGWRYTHSDSRGGHNA